MNIRPFEIDDQAELIALWRETGLVTSKNDPQKDIKRKLQVDRELLLVATIDGVVIGSVMGGYEGHRGWVNYLAVSANFQRQGIASKLMRRVESDLLLKGCAKINLQLRATNSSVLAFYAALGYLDDKVISLGKRLIHDN
ncbi:MAG: ribosomal protein S18 acetylase RimI-like enzyme [Arenicella sp.]|jgi:ribosomal protein S18 acetylase RimI-like enzyme